MSFLKNLFKSKREQKNIANYNLEVKTDCNTIINSIISKEFVDFSDPNLNQIDKDNNNIKVAFLIITLLLYPEIYKLPQNIINYYQRLLQSLINKYSNDMEHFFRDVKHLISHQHPEQYGGAKRKTRKSKRTKSRKSTKKTKHRK
jgi:hypothetical protein